MKNKILAIFMLLCSLAYGQMDQYDYQRELLGVNDQWHKLVLPNDLFDNISANFSDIRVYGIDAANDTLEAPYILEQKEDEVLINDVAFKIINTVYNAEGYYFTLALKSAQDINQIALDFRQVNFDWKLKLEGSQNQQKWFTVVDNYRVLSIRNELTNYEFTKVKFPTANYRFFRIHIKSSQEIDLVKASMSLSEKSKGNYQVFTPKTVSIDENKSLKQTEVTIDLGMLVPISQLELNVEDEFDYYRPFRIQYVIDSFQTEKGWKYNYGNLTSGTLSSIEDHQFSFQSTLLQKLKVTINNYDNQSLNINSFIAKGPKQDLIIRFTQEGRYFLVYGNELARSPNYDINHFTNNIPEDLALLQLGEEQKTNKRVSPKKEPLFKNKAWLWGIMSIIILLLGWFSLKMIKGA